MASAEKRLLDETYPDRTEEQTRQQRSFLKEFATSTAFKETSRIGSCRFTFPVTEVLNAYSKQFCSGAPPVMRAYETVLYKKEVMYVVLIHNPGNPKYENYPLLSKDPNAICGYEDGHFIWKAQAMCGELSYELDPKPDKNQLGYKDWLKPFPKYYVWDNVAIALHMEGGQVLEFDEAKLRDNEGVCDKGEVSYPGASFGGCKKPE